MVKILSRIKRCGVDSSWGESKVEMVTHRFKLFWLHITVIPFGPCGKQKAVKFTLWLWEAWSCFAQKSELFISSYFPCMCFRIRKSSDSEMSREQALTAVEDKQ